MLVLTLCGRTNLDYHRPDHHLHLRNLLGSLPPLWDPVYAWWWRIASEESGTAALRSSRYAFHAARGRGIVIVYGGLHWAGAARLGFVKRTSSEAFGPIVWSYTGLGCGSDRGCVR